MNVYTAQSGDSLEVVAVHFGVAVSEITSQLPLPSTGFIDPGTRLIIPNRINQPTITDRQLLPDSEVVYSPSAVDFDVAAYIDKAGGRLSSYREYLVTSDWTTGSQDVQRIAFESSINPRLLLALLQYWSGWVQGQPFPSVGDRYPMGQFDDQFQGLYEQMRWAIAQLSAGYYGWRSGKLTRITFADDTSIRIAPGANAGTVALEYLFSKRYSYAQWQKEIDPQGPFMQLYLSMFGDPVRRAAAVGPLFPPGLNQPDLILPFEVGRLWSFTGGPHPGWGEESALAALDFAPASDHSGCTLSDTWVVASAPGRVVRSVRGYVVQDLDGDGYEQTGWDVLYLHVATEGRAALGVWLNPGDRVGRPSCEGGEATGTHLHFARKYNGEWVEAGGPLPFVLSGWIAHAGRAPYEGTLTKGNLVVTANQNSARGSEIKRNPGE
jgi:murein DD-endopeptidase MepM/ murein hydrolase activator NlpD